MNRSALAIFGIIVIVGLAAIGYAISNNLFGDTTPPVISDLAWEPTREINDKIYDVTISFSGEDASSNTQDN